jgi:lathosterol oxidase
MDSWGFLVIVSVLVGLAILWGIGGYYHVRYYVLRRHEPETWKCQPKRFLRPEQNHQAMRLSTMNLMIGGFLSGTFVWAVIHEKLPIPIYFDVADYGWTYTIVSSLLFFLLVDLLAYYAHRLLHVRFMFKRYHCWHHRYVATTPWVVTAMHPVEFLIFQGTTFIPMFVMPTWYGAAIFTFVYALVFNIIDHSGVRLYSRIPWQGASMFHDDHHLHFHVNFGQHLSLWDRWFGTHRREGRRYGVEVFGGKGEPDGSDGGDKGGFVRY